MLPNCFSVHSNMAPAAQVRRSRQERGGRGKGEDGGRLRCGSKEMRKQVSLALSLSFCDGCKAVDHAPDLSVFLIKILYLKARRTKKKKRWKALSKQSVLRGREGRGHHTRTV